MSGCLANSLGRQGGIRSGFPVFLLAALSPSLACAEGFDGSQISGWWAVPFCGLLLSIAVLPLVSPKVWSHHFGKITALWALLTIVPFTLGFGARAALEQFMHALVGDYIPFIVLLSCLFTVCGGIHVRGSVRGTPVLNTAILAVGAVLASLMGTTGATMLLLRPIIKANEGRRHVVHVVIFFIFIVANAGGFFTPLGDPPLFLGFLRGVDFFWTLKHAWQPACFLIGALLILFFVLDGWYHKKEEARPQAPEGGRAPVGVDGAANFILLAGVVSLVLLSGLWKSEAGFHLAGVSVGWPALVRDAGLVAILFISRCITRKSIYEANRFSWAPMLEVGKLFAGIFLTMVPVIAMLRAGESGSLAEVVRLVTREDGEHNVLMYFWVSGALSAFLDNAPTYLVFFNMAGGDAAALMTTHAGTLAAISMGAVFMGASTYIGNAPNLMVKVIAEEHGIKMPGFAGYMAWSCGILIPLLLLLSWIFLG